VSTTDPPEIDVCVVIPCLNAAEVLPGQLEALAMQVVDRSWEVLVVDNGSTDATADVAASFRDRFAHLRVINEPERGRHHACNAGVAATGARSVVFVDADDEVQPGYVAALATALDQADAVAASIDHGRFASATDTATYGVVQTDALAPGFGFLPYAGGGTLGVRADVFRAIGGFRSVPFGEDADLSWRLQLAGHEIAFVPEAHIAVRQRDDLRSMFRQHRRFGEAQAQLYERFAGAGMPSRGWRTALGDWRSAIVGLLMARGHDERARATRRVARALGRIVGSVKARVLYL
jgi:glycosyltransferase involved in cell wall biosynthesis